MQHSAPVKFILLRLLVPRWPVRWAVPYGEEVVVTRNVTVPRQVVWILEVTGTPTAGVLDHTDSGLWGSKESKVTLTSSTNQTSEVFWHKPRTSAFQTISSPHSFTGSIGRKNTKQIQRQVVPKALQIMPSADQHLSQNHTIPGWKGPRGSSGPIFFGKNTV